MLAGVVVMPLPAILAPTAAAQTAVLEAPGTKTELWLATFDTAWTLVRDTHFDPDLNGIDWDAVRTELRPKVEAAGHIEEVRLIIRDMLGRLGQSHFALMSQEAVDAARPGRAADESSDDPSTIEHDETPPKIDDNITDDPGDVGLEAQLIDGQMVVSRVEPESPAALSGIKPGWVITAIGDRELDEVVELVSAELSPRMAAYQMAQIVSHMLSGNAGEDIELAMLDATDVERTIETERRIDPSEVVQFGNLPPMACRLTSWFEQSSGTRVGVVRFNIWMLPMARQFDEAIDTMRSADGVVIDLRGNPGGVAGMASGIAGHFINEKVTLGTLRTRGRNLKFPVNPRRVNTSKKPTKPFAGPVAVLIDGGTGSTSEIFAGGMQALDRIRVFGEPSMGAALPAMMDRLPNGDVLLHAFADFLDADGQSMEKDGVVPDEAVSVTRHDLLEGRDPVMEEAIRWIADQHE